MLQQFLSDPSNTLAIRCTAIVILVTPLLLVKRIRTSVASTFARWKILLFSRVDKEAASRNIRVSGIYIYPGE